MKRTILIVGLAALSVVVPRIWLPRSVDVTAAPGLDQGEIASEPHHAEPGAGVDNTGPKSPREWWSSFRARAVGAPLQFKRRLNLSGTASFSNTSRRAHAAGRPVPLELRHCAKEWVCLHGPLAELAERA